MKTAIKLSFCFTMLLSASAYGQVVTNIVTNASGQIPVINQVVTIPQSLGTTIYSNGTTIPNGVPVNLFHSFSTFSIGTGDTANFTGDPSLTNVISRVTGGSVSTIDGLFQWSGTNGVLGHPNFYFINPAGVTFGANARIDVPAAFHVSTADKINFADKNSFYADPKAQSVLTVAEPASFGFLGDSSHAVIINGNGKIAELTAKTGQDINIVAGTIAIKDANLTAEAGTIRLTATGANNTTVPINGTAEIANGRINIDNSWIDVSGKGSGKLDIQGGNISLYNYSLLLADNTGRQNASPEKGINITAKNLTLNSGSRITTSAFGKGNASTININSNNLVSDFGYIRTDTYDLGNAGTININNSNKLSVSNGWISSDSYDAGNAGTVNVKTNSLKLTDSGQISSLSLNSGDAGNVYIDAGTIDIHGENSSIETNTTNTQIANPGNAGFVNIKSNSLTLLDGGQINSSTANYGNAGDVVIKAGQIIIDSLYGKAQISSDTRSDGNAGFVIVTANSLSLLNGGQISSSSSGNGHAGNIFINAADITVDGWDSKIATDTENSLNTGKDLRGTIFIKSDSLKISNQGWIRSDTQGSGNAGNVIVEAGKVLLDFASISSDTHNTGNAGMVLIGGDEIKVLNKSWISSDTWSTGNAGFVYITGNNIEVSDQAKISSDTQGYSNGYDIPGTAGDIVMSANNLSVAKSGVISSDNVDGKGGNIVLDVKNISVTEGGVISTTTYGSGNAGNIFVENADNVAINGVDENLSWVVNGHEVTGQYSGFYLNTESAGNGGSLWLNSKNLTISDGGTISAVAVFGQADSTKNISAGNVYIEADKVDLTGGGLIAATTSSAANAGSVTVNAKESLNISGQFDRSLHPAVTNPRESEYSGILSNASYVLDATATKLGTGGSVVVNAGSLILSDRGLINVSTEGDKSAGSVTVNAAVVKLDNASITAEATATSQGQAGNITVTADNAVSLSNHAKISIQNDATAIAPKAAVSSAITVSAPDIDLKDSEITTAATGNVDAGNINISFSHWLTMDPSFITTAANLGNGGIITIAGGELIYLQNSGFLTSVTGDNSNGGNINVNANTLVMETGVIQANAVGGAGGDINILLRTLIPSQNRLIIGGSRVVWQPYQAGFNVIQAASESGVNGSVNVSSPQFDISGSVTGLDTSGLVLPRLAYNSCQSEEKTHPSSLTRGGKGGVTISETKAVFIPPAMDSPKAVLNSGKNSQDIKTLTAHSTKLKSDYACVPISF